MEFEFNTFLVAVIAISVYLIPSIVAGARHHHNGPAILTLNLFLGWTGLGWIIALVWAFTEVRERQSTKADRTPIGSVDDVPENLRRDV